MAAVFGVLGALALVALAWMSGKRVEVSHLTIVSSDTLYIPLLYEGSILDFRTSSASNLIPDWFYYALSSAAGLNPIDALILAGILQCSITTMLLARYAGVVIAVLYNLLYFLFGFSYYFSISFHQGLIATTVLYLAFSSPTARRVLSFVFTLADPLFGLISSIFLVARACIEKRFDFAEAGLIVLGFAGALYLSETSVDLAKFAIVLWGILSIGCVVTLRSVETNVRPLLMAVSSYLSPVMSSDATMSEYRFCSALLFLAALGSIVIGQPERYALPLLVAALAFYVWRGDKSTPLRNRPPLAWFSLGLISFVSLTAFVMPSLASSSRNALSQFDCLARALRSVPVDAVATDFWTFKPLYFTQGGRSGMRLLQLDFRDGSPDTHINAHRFARGQAHYIVKNLSVCGSIDSQTRSWAAHCSDEWYARLGVKRRTEVCDAFEVIETDRPVDFAPWERYFSAKHTAFAYNFRQNFGKLGFGS